MYLEVLMKRKRHPLMNYSCIYIYNISDIIILWKIYWLLLKIFNIIIIRVDKIFFTIFVLSMEFDVISWLCLVLNKECQSWTWWLNLKSYALPRQKASLGLCKFLFVK